MLFALNEVYYPGDKWNYKYVSRFNQKPNEFDKTIEQIFNTSIIGRDNKEAIFKNLIKLIRELKDISSYKP